MLTPQERYMVIATNDPTPQILDYQIVLDDPGIDLQAKMDSILSNYTSNNGLNALHTSFYYATSAESLRIQNGDERSPVTTDVSGKIVITGLDFSAEDSKKKFTVEIDNNNILVGESVTITVRIFESDGVTPFNINATFRLPYISTNKTSSIRMTFVSGVATRTLTLNTDGIYTLGLKRKGNFVLQGEMPVLEVDL